MTADELYEGGVAAMQDFARACAFGSDDDRATKGARLGSFLMALRDAVPRTTPPPAQAAAVVPVEARGELTDAVRDVLAERQRQVTAEGWTLEHDDEHQDGSLAAAAACYALHTEPAGNVGDYLRFWPWDSESWKPKDRRRNLIRATALILAEIERGDRDRASRHAAAAPWLD